MTTALSRRAISALARVKTGLKHGIWLELEAGYLTVSRG